MALRAVADILREDDLAERLFRGVGVDFLRMLQVVGEVNAVDSSDDWHRPETAPAVERSPALVFERVTGTRMRVIVAGLAVIRVERRGMDGAFVEMEDRVAMTIGAVQGDLLFRRDCSNLEHDVADANGVGEPGNLAGLRQVVNIDPIRA